MEEIPAELIFNWDHTVISIVPGLPWTLEVKRVKRVEITGISEKRQTTAMFCARLAGDLLLSRLSTRVKQQHASLHTIFLLIGI